MGSRTPLDARQRQFIESLTEKEKAFIRAVNRTTKPNEYFDLAEVAQSIGMADDEAGDIWERLGREGYSGNVLGGGHLESSGRRIAKYLEEEQEEQVRRDAEATGGKGGSVFNISVANCQGVTEPPKQGPLTELQDKLLMALYELAWRNAGQNVDLEKLRRALNLDDLSARQTVFGLIERNVLTSLTTFVGKRGEWTSLTQGGWHYADTLFKPQHERGKPKAGEARYWTEPQRAFVRAALQSTSGVPNAAFQPLALAVIAGVDTEDVHPIQVQLEKRGVIEQAAGGVPGMTPYRFTDFGRIHAKEEFGYGKNDPDYVGGHPKPLSLPTPEPPMVEAKPDAEESRRLCDIINRIKARPRDLALSVAGRQLTLDGDEQVYLLTIAARAPISHQVLNELTGLDVQKQSRIWNKVSWVLDFSIEQPQLTLNDNGRACVQKIRDHWEEQLASDRFVVMKGGNPLDPNATVVNLPDPHAAIRKEIERIGKKVDALQNHPPEPTEREKEFLFAIAEENDQGWVALSPLTKKLNLTPLEINGMTQALRWAFDMEQGSVKLNADGRKAIAYFRRRREEQEIGRQLTEAARAQETAEAANEAELPPDLTQTPISDLENKFVLAVHEANRGGLGTALVKYVAETVNMDEATTQEVIASLVARKILTAPAPRKNDNRPFIGKTEGGQYYVDGLYTANRPGVAPKAAAAVCWTEDQRALIRAALDETKGHPQAQFNPLSLAVVAGLEPRDARDVSDWLLRRGVVENVGTANQRFTTYGLSQAVETFGEQWDQQSAGRKTSPVDPTVGGATLAAERNVVIVRGDIVAAATEGGLAKDAKDDAPQPPDGAPKEISWLVRFIVWTSKIVPLNKYLVALVGIAAAIPVIKFLVGGYFFVAVFFILILLCLMVAIGLLNKEMHRGSLLARILSGILLTAITLAVCSVIGLAISTTFFGTPPFAKELFFGSKEHKGLIIRE